MTDRGLSLTLVGIAASPIRRRIIQILSDWRRGADVEHFAVSGDVVVVKLRVGGEHHKERVASGEGPVKAENEHPSPQWSLARNPTPRDGKSQNRRIIMCCKQRQKAWCKQTTWELRNLLAAGQKTYLMPKSCGGCPLGRPLPTL